jgi:hypothetical protein
MRINNRDVEKINSEINQHINSRLVVAMTAVTVVGVIEGWILQLFITHHESQDNIIDLVIALFGLNGHSVQRQLESEIYLLSIMLVVLLFFLYYIYSVTSNNMHVLGAYLRLKKLSQWEIDFKKFDDKGMRFCNLGRSLIPLFVLLFLIAVLSPMVLSALLSLQNHNNIMLYFWNPLFFIHVVLSIATFGVIFFMEIYFLRKKKQLETIWKMVLR